MAERCSWTGTCRSRSASSLSRNRAVPAAGGLLRSRRGRAPRRAGGHEPLSREAFLPILAARALPQLRRLALRARARPDCRNRCLHHLGVDALRRLGLARARPDRASGDGSPRRPGRTQLGGLDETPSVSPEHAARPDAASSVAPVSSGYERSLRPCLGTTSALRRRAPFHQALLDGWRLGDQVAREGCRASPSPRRGRPAPSPRAARRGPLGVRPERAGRPTRRWRRGGSSRSGPAREATHRLQRASDRRSRWPSLPPAAQAPTARPGRDRPRRAGRACS